jgi:hypothetical protein
MAEASPPVAALHSGNRPDQIHPYEYGIQYSESMRAKNTGFAIARNTVIIYSTP